MSMSERSSTARRDHQLAPGFGETFSQGRIIGLCAQEALKMEDSGEPGALALGDGRALRMPPQSVFNGNER